MNQTLFISKLAATLSPVNYSMGSLNMSALIGKHISIEFLNNRTCVHCNEVSQSLKQDGHCSKCAATLAKCDSCSISPEKCHYDAGTCREPKWGEDNCLTTHTVYLSFTSGYKVGITRNKNIPQRWVDQGAMMAIPLFEVKNRLFSGLIETLLKPVIADKTNWRKMLMSDEAPTLEAFLAKAAQMQNAAAKGIDNLNITHGEGAARVMPLDNPTDIAYTVSQRPEKLKNPIKLDKEPIISGVLHGIKGQYLYIDDHVFNVRNHIGYHVNITSPK